VPAPQIVECARVRSALPFAIATGETNFTAGEFERLLDAEAADILMPNLQRVGGVTPWRQVAAAAELRNVAVASHVYPEISTHLVAAAANAVALEVIPWWPRLFAEPLDVVAGQAQPPAGPGLGFSLDPAVLSRHRVD
jgi:L-alanine-DL-glutamate epimerase-like enolase superfamily enzyme